MLPQAHQSCQNKAKGAAEAEVPSIVIDNTNIFAAHRKTYEDIAEQNGYNIEYVVFKDILPEILFKRNVHGVPLAAIERMIKQMEIPQEGIDKKVIIVKTGE